MRLVAPLGQLALRFRVDVVDERGQRPGAGQHVLPDPHAGLHGQLRGEGVGAAGAHADGGVADGSFDEGGERSEDLEVVVCQLAVLVLGHRAPPAAVASCAWILSRSSHPAQP